MLARARHLLKRQKRRGISHEKISPWNSIIHIGFIRKRVFLLSSCYDKMGNGIRNYPLSLSSSLSKLVTGIIFSTDHGRQVAYNHGTRKYPAKWRGLWIIFWKISMNESLSQTVIANIALHDWEIGPRKMVLSLEAKERTCGRERAANYRYPGHEITALSLWKRLLPTQLDEVAKLRQPSPPPPSLSISRRPF